MTRDTFLLAFVLAAAVLAGWVAFRLPSFGPQSLRAGWVNLALALVLGAVLTPVMNLVPGQPDMLAVLVALICVALPVVTYMFLSGIWLVRLAVEQTLAPRG
jgi:hypothetical protein